MSVHQTHDASDNPGFGEHLEILRKHLIRIIIAVVVFSTLAFLFKTIIFDYILLYPASPDFIFTRILCNLGGLLNTDALCFQEVNFILINISVTGQFMIHITVSIAAGFILAFPYALLETWRFIKPALTHKEKHAVRGFVFYASLLFFTGVLFGYFIITPLALNFFGNYSVSTSLTNQFIIQSYISVIIKSSIATGIAFQLPLVIHILSVAGLATPAGLKKYRKHAIIALFIVAAILTPADPFSMIMVALPLLLLYELSIMVSRKVAQRK
jgi:sec-independent protein translocase protein TatC